MKNSWPYVLAGLHAPRTAPDQTTELMRERSALTVQLMRANAAKLTGNEITLQDLMHGMTSQIPVSDVILFYFNDQLILQFDHRDALHPVWTSFPQIPEGELIAPPKGIDAEHFQLFKRLSEIVTNELKKVLGRDPLPSDYYQRIQQLHDLRKSTLRYFLDGVQIMHAQWKSTNAVALFLGRSKKPAYDLKTS